MAVVLEEQGWGRALLLLVFINLKSEMGILWLNIMAVDSLSGKAERCFLLSLSQYCGYLISADICMDPLPIKPSFWTKTLDFLMFSSDRVQVS